MEGKLLYVGSLAERKPLGEGTVALLPLIFAFAHPLQHRESGLLGIAGGERLELDGRAEGGNAFADWFLACRAPGKFRGAERPAQCEFTAASRAISGAKFIFVEG